MTITEALDLFELGDRPDDARIKSAYRAVAQIIHPDRHAGSETATRLLKRYTVARDQLLEVSQDLRVRASQTRERQRSHRGRRARDEGRRAAEFREQLEHVTAFSTWLARDVPRGRSVRVIFAGTALLAFGTLALKVIEDSRGEMP